MVAVFNRIYNLGELELVVNRFKSGVAAEVGDMVPSDDVRRSSREPDRRTWRGACEKVGAGGSPPETAAAVEFILEGLHLNKRLNKDKVGGKIQYRG